MRVTDRDEDVSEIVTEKPVKVVVSCCFMGKGRSSVLRVTQVPADFELFFSFNSCAREGATVTATLDAKLCELFQPTHP